MVYKIILCGFSNLSSVQLIMECINRHGTTSGQSYVIGYIKSLGYHVQRSRIRECLARLDPENSALR